MSAAPRHPAVGAVELEAAAEVRRRVEEGSRVDAADVAHAGVEGAVGVDLEQAPREVECPGAISKHGRVAARLAADDE